MRKINTELYLLPALFLIMFLVGILFTSFKDSNVVQTERKQPEVLLLGTFHFDNPQLDVVKTKPYDILSPEKQKQIENLSRAIEAFKPSKIFVEWPYQRQNELDSIYSTYLEDKDRFSKQKSELVQLGFRAAAALNHAEIIGIDYRNAEFPFDSMRNYMQHHQPEILHEYMSMIQQTTSHFDSMIQADVSVVKLLTHLNSKKEYMLSNKFQMTKPLQVGGEDNLVGAYLAAEWVKRNLFMVSNVMTHVNDSDDRILILVGAGHAAIFDLLFKQMDVEVLHFNSFVTEYLK